MPQLIDEAQSAFIRGRLISDNIAIAFEAFHWIKNGCGGKDQIMAMKVDMSKAYNHVEWDYLEWMLNAMNFLDRLIRIIMRCVSIVTFQVLVNGKATRPFKLGRGLGQ